jgi:hypothetical protein
MGTLAELLEALNKFKPNFTEQEKREQSNVTVLR